MAKSRAFSQQTSPPDTVGSAHQGLERKYFTGGKYFKILCYELKMYFLPVKIVSQYQPDMINLSNTVTKTDFLISGGLVLTQQVCFVFKIFQFFRIFLASKMFHV